jgi:hypothetical protein
MEPEGSLPNSQLALILSQMNPLHSTPSFPILKIRFFIINPTPASLKWAPPSRVSSLNVYAFVIWFATSSQERRWKRHLTAFGSPQAEALIVNYKVNKQNLYDLLSLTRRNKYKQNMMLSCNTIDLSLTSGQWSFWIWRRVVSYSYRGTYCFHLSRNSEVEISSEALLSFDQTSWRHSPEDRSLNIRRHETLGSRTTVTAFWIIFWYQARKLSLLMDWKCIVFQCYDIRIKELYG